jgi:hypothetical protein
MTLDNTTRSYLHLRNSETNQINTIEQISTTTHYRHVSVQITLDRNMHQQIIDMSLKCQQMATIFNQTFFNPKVSQEDFSTVFTLSICYPLAATSIPKSKLQNLQKPVIHVVLARTGFNCHMPREVVLVSRLRGWNRSFRSLFRARPSTITSTGPILSSSDLHHISGVLPICCGTH